MKEFFKYLGIIIILIGVAVLAIPSFLQISNNTYLATGGILLVVGLLAHIGINRRISE